MRRLSPLSLATLVSVTGCGGEPNSASAGPQSLTGTATLFVDGEITAFTIEPCERDDRTVRLTGRGESDETLDVVAEVLGDAETVEPADGSSLTALDLDQGDLSVVGPDAWAEQGMTGTAPGDMAASRITDDLVQMAGQLIGVLDEDGHPTGEELKIWSLDAHCEFAD